MTSISPLRALRNGIFMPLAIVAAFAMAVCGAARAEDAAGEALKRIREAGKIVIGTDPSTRPISYSDKGELLGYEIAWGRLIAKELGVEPEFIQGQFSGLISGLLYKQYDVVMAGLIMTDERRKVIDFSVSHLADGAIAVVGADDPKTDDISNIKGLTVGVLAGSGFIKDINAIGGYKEMVEYPGTPEVLADLKAGRIDVGVMGKSIASYFISIDKAAVPVKIVGDFYRVTRSAIGIRKEDTDLREAIDRIIEAKKADGTFDRLAMEYFGYTFPQ